MTEEHSAERVEMHRQSLVLRGGSCDVRVGQDLNDKLGTFLKQFSGTPRRTLLVTGPEVAFELTETCRRSLVDIGFDVRQTCAAAGREARSLAYTQQLQEILAKEGISADDPVVVIGDADLISGVLYVTATWYGSCILACVPTTLDAMTEVLCTPRSIDIPGAQDALLAKGNIRLALCDVDNLPPVTLGETPDASTLMGYAVMAATAMVSGKNTFTDFSLALDEFMAGNPEVVTKQIVALTKARSHVVASSALAMRQGIQYGVDIARALRICLEAQEVDEQRYCIDKDVCDALLLAEGIRIAARLSAAHTPEKTDLVDLVFAQDGLLNRLGLTEVACVVDPQAFLATLKEVAFTRSNRFMPAIPLDYGRVRLTSIDDGLIEEHIAAWCKSRRKLARRRAKEAVGAE